MIRTVSTRPAQAAPVQYKAGYRRFKWRDEKRGRPVWADVWYPTTAAADETAMFYGLGQGMVIPDASVADLGTPFPVVVMSHGALGSAPACAWITEYLARHGLVVVGVSHYGESRVYGPETVDPSAVTRLWDRPGDCSFALTQVLTFDEFEPRVAPECAGAIGHSSGGATVIALGGGICDPDALLTYCCSEAGKTDRGCQYGQDGARSSQAPSEATMSARDVRIKSIVVMDPAAGPGFSEASLGAVDVPVLVVGSEENDFLPFEHHAGRYAVLLRRASLVRLRSGEGHFVYLNSCTSDLSANGVPLCVDRAGVDREAVHAALAPKILAFLSETIPIPATGV